MSARARKEQRDSRDTACKMVELRLRARGLTVRARACTGGGA